MSTSLSSHSFNFFQDDPAEVEGDEQGGSRRAGAGDGAGDEEAEARHGQRRGNRRVRDSPGKRQTGSDRQVNICCLY